MASQPAPRRQPAERAQPAHSAPAARVALPAKTDDERQRDDDGPVPPVRQAIPAIATAARTQRRPAQRARDAQKLPTIIERNWVFMSPMMGASVIAQSILARQLPTITALALMLCAILLVAATPLIQRFEVAANDQPWLRRGLVSMVMGLPMFLFGTGLAIWTNALGSASWPVAVGLLVIVSAMISVIHNRRATRIVAALSTLWTGVAIVAGTGATMVVLAGGAVFGWYTTWRQSIADTAARELQQERERAQQRAEEILHDYEQTGQGWFWETDRRGQIVYISPTIGEQLSVKAKVLKGRSFTDLFAPDLDARDSERTLAFHLSARSAFSELALRAATRNEERWWSVSGRPLYDGFGNFVGFRGSGHDLTEKRRSEANATRLAHFDSLTGLANRLQMAMTLEKILSAPNSAHRACAIFLLDLDRFKQVNDTLGHPAGDSLLTQVSRRLQRVIGEAGQVGRLGGDEFQVILPGHHKREDLAGLARRVIAELSQPYSIEGHRVVIGASLGISLSPDDGTTSDDLVRNADLALYAAKDGGRGRHHFYASDLHSDAEERRQLEQDLRDAITTGQLELWYQPVVHTTTERITGFEALMRWNHPERGPMSPAKFIPVAEDAGLIAPIGEWALRTACADLAQWPDSVRVAVNVSTLQFANPALPTIITNALATAQIDPSRLELEITESVFLNDDEGIEAMFQSLKRIGVRLALDDFGTGYSSLGYLKRAPFDKIKIDQSFVRGATITGSRNGAIIASIVNLAEALGMETTAEGVETLDELDLVRMLGCSHVQGYIYEKPLRREDASQRLETGLTAIAKGPKAARAVRHTMLRKIVLDHGGQQYQAMIRNISATGAMIEGLWNVPPGTIFRLLLAEGHVVTATARWCQDDRMGVEFSTPLSVDEQGRIAIVASIGNARARPSILRGSGGQGATA